MLKNKFQRRVWMTMLLQRALSGDVGPSKKMDAMHMRMDGRKEITNAMVAAQFLATTLPVA